MIRVGSLWDLSLVKGGAVDNKTGLSAKEQLDAIFSAVRPLIAEKDDICRQLNQAADRYAWNNAAMAAYYQVESIIGVAE